MSIADTIADTIPDVIALTAQPHNTMKIIPLEFIRACRQKENGCY
jgi:hypothetical protein